MQRRTMKMLAVLAAFAAACGGVPAPEAQAPPLAAAGGDGLAPPLEDIDVNVTPAPSECEGYVALTFDDGPTLLTGQLLDILDRVGVPAVFFNMGVFIEQRPDDVRAMVAAGHQVGNHTMTHAHLSALSPAEQLAEIRSTSEAHEAVTGDGLELFRPPYGDTNPAVRAVAADEGLTEVLWNADSRDFEATSVEEILEASTSMEDGGILLLHDGKPLTIAAVPQIVDHYHRAGMCFGLVGVTTEAQDVPLGSHDARAVAP
jgi:peptidoglycan/xylan/chitin deacetylase (PgdA/CDA1 family)